MATYSATGSAIVDADAIFAGRTEDGALIITNTVEDPGGVFQSLALEAGRPDETFAPTIGVITLQGGETNVSLGEQGEPGTAATIAVGVDNPGGTGALRIESGATLSSTNQGFLSGEYNPDTGFALVTGGYQNVRVGDGPNSFGEVFVDGVGSQLLTAGASPAIFIGEAGGTGEMTITDGGYVRTHFATVGRYGLDASNISVGRLTVDGVAADGTRSRFRISDDGGGFADPRYSGEAGIFGVGRTAYSEGRVYVVNGGDITITNTDGLTDTPFFRLGRNNGAYGYALISGTVR